MAPALPNYRPATSAPARPGLAACTHALYNAKQKARVYSALPGKSRPPCTPVHVRRHMPGRASQPLRCEGRARFMVGSVGRVPTKWLHFGSSCPNAPIQVQMRCTAGLSTPGGPPPGWQPLAWQTTGRPPPGWRPFNLANVSRTQGSLNIHEVAGCSSTNQTLRRCATSSKTMVLSTMTFARRTGSLLVSPCSCPGPRRWKDELKKMKREHGGRPR